MVSFSCFFGVQKRGVFWCQNTVLSPLQFILNGSKSFFDDCHKDLWKYYQSLFQKGAEEKRPYLSTDPFMLLLPTWRSMSVHRHTADDQDHPEAAQVPAGSSDYHERRPSSSPRVAEPPNLRIPANSSSELRSSVQNWAASQ